MTDDDEQIVNKMLARERLLEFFTEYDRDKSNSIEVVRAM